MKFIDLTGQRFDRLLVMSRANNTKTGQARWNCRCDCGKEKIINGQHLRNNATKSCGCLGLEKLLEGSHNKFIDLTGCRFDKLVVDKYMGQTKRGISRWLCRCDCGKEKIVNSSNLKNGNTRSCGCLKLPHQIVSRIDERHVFAICLKHGPCKHFINQKNSVCCMICKNLCAKKRYDKRDKISINSFSHRLRTSIRSAFKRILTNNAIKIKGCFRHLDYTPLDLFNHLENVRNLQTNNCPCCNISYNINSFDIDHIIPTSTAKTREELLKLFDLKNLSLLCWRCNRHVKRDRLDIKYNTYLNMCIN